MASALTGLSPQEPASGINHVVLLTCAVCLLTYAVMAVILRKLDQLDVRRVRAIPFCGKGGRFKYEILVKTGWGRGSGEALLAGQVCKAVTYRFAVPQGGHQCAQVGRTSGTIAESLSYDRLCGPMDCGPPGSSVHGILQARILEWVAIPFWGSS